MPTYIRSKINTDLPVEITLNSEGSETILNQDGTFRLPGVGSNGTGSLRVVDSRVEVKLSTGEWKQIIVGPDLAAVALSGLFSDLISTPTTIDGYGIVDAYTKTQVDTGISTAINNLVNGAPDLLNTLNELSQALNNDASFAATITSSLNGKLNLSGGTMTGALILAGAPTSLLHATTKQYVDTYVNNATASLSISTNTTDDLLEGNDNLYYTTARFDTRFASKSTSNLSEGTNLYYTDTRARSAISVTGNGSYDNTTGVITINSGGGVGNVISVNTKTGVIVLTTSDITEGTNQYFTPARARAAISVAGSGSYDDRTGVITINGGVTSVNAQTGEVTLSTTNINEGTNLYYTNSRFDAQLATKTTSNLTEGTNKYYTDARARAAISVGGSLSYNSSTGTISYNTPNTDAVSEGTNNRYFTQGRSRSSVSAGSGISYSSDTGIIAVNTNVIATKNDLTTTNVTEGTNLYYTIDRTKDDGFATKAYVDGQVAQVSLNVIDTIDNVNSFMKTTAITTAALITLVDSVTAPSFAQSDWNETNSTKLDYIRNKPSLAAVATSGNYNDLTNKPSIPSITGLATETYVTSRGYLTTVSYADLTGKPVLFSGSYNDLTNKPALFPGDYNSLINKPSLFSGAYADLTGKPTLFGGSYNDLTDKPALFSGGYNDLTNKPVLFSGSYNDLTNKPSIPAAQVQSDWNATSGLGQILNKPLLADVATSGSYNDLTNKPDVSNTARSSVSAGIGIDYNSSTGVIASTITQYTDTMARNAISSGTGINYNSSTGVITNTITQYTDTMAKGAISVSGSLSYNNSTGVISYTTPSTTGIAEGANLYFTNTRARAAVSAGTGISYNSSTGVITNTITQYTDAMSKAAVSAGTGISYNSSTGVITNTVTQYTDAMARTAISSSTGLNYNPVTGVITNTITQYTDTMARGAISVDGSLNYDNSTGIISYTTPNTNGIVEGATNKYFTNSRARAAISVSGSLSYNQSTGIISYTTPSTTGIVEGTNLYYTDARARAAITAGTGITVIGGVVATTITQYTDSMAKAAISVTGDLSYSSSTGVIGFTQNKAWSALTGTPTTIAGYGITNAYTKTEVDSAITTAVAGKDNTDEITEGSTNKYYTDTRARAAISATGDLNYNSSTGIMSLSADTIIDGGSITFDDSYVIGGTTDQEGFYVVPVRDTTATTKGLFYNTITKEVTTATVAAVATSGSYNDLSDKPTLFSGSYNDLSDKPSAYVLPNATTTQLGGVKVDGTSIIVSDGIISVDSSYSTKAYVDGQIAQVISSIETGPIQTVADQISTLTTTTLPRIITALGNLTWADINGKPTLATVATSGSYADLINKPTNVSTFTNDAGYLTSVTNISGNAGTVTNGVVTTGSYSNPSWITNLAYSKLTGAPVLVASATIDTTNAANITSGTLPLSRLSGITTTQLSSSAGITNSQLANSSITVNGQSVALGNSITVTANTTNALTIGTGLSGTSYNGSSAVTIANTGVTSAVAGTGVSVSSATGAVTFSIGQAVSTTSNVTFNNLTVSGNLTVTGTTTSIQTSTLDVADKNITVAKGAANAAAANGAGLTVEGPATQPTFTYTSADDRWNMNKNLNVSTVYGNLVGNVTGNADTATTATTAGKWTTARTITLGGDLSGSVSIDGSSNVTLTATVSGNATSLGVDTTGNYVASITNGSYITGANGGSEGAVLTLAVDATSANTASKVVARDASGNFSAGTITAALTGNVTGNITGSSGSTTGNAATATTLQTARTISGVSFNGSANITLSTSGITESGNLYYTDARARSAVSAGTGISYDSSTGVIANTITQYTNAMARSAVSAGTGISYNSSTGVITNTITQYTDTMTRAAVSFASGSGAYNSTTGVFTIPTNTNQLTNGAGFITGITGNNVITALGYTPYSASNPSGYTNNTGTVTSITGGSYLTGGAITTSGTLSVDATSANTASKVVARDASGNFSAGTITAALSGNATTATTLQTARNINGVSFNGSADITVHSAGTGIGISGTTVTNLLATSGGAIGGAIAVSGSITATGDVTAYYSDARLKTEIEPIVDPISKIMSLRGVTFRPNQTALDLGITDREEVGVIAQEVETVLPQLVVDSGYEGYKTVKYDKLTALLIEAVKNQQAQIDELKQEIKRLKNG